MDDYDFVIDMSDCMNGEVLCDFCNTDYTESPDCGGYIIGSWAVCPRCALDGLKSAKQYDELVDEFCPDGVSFADFVRSNR